MLQLGARWLAFTDADPAVSRRWLVDQLSLSADVVCGTVEASDWVRTWHAAGDGTELDADASFENHPSALFDAVVFPDGTEAVAALAVNGQAPKFVRDQFRHCKTMLALGAGRVLLERAGIATDDGDEGLLWRNTSTPSGTDPRRVIEPSRHIRDAPGAFAIAISIWRTDHA